VQLLHEYRDFIFNHNEALLYQWILKYAGDLFAEIQKLVTSGRWSISGGWYLQPDVNLPRTESIIRHIAEGRRFFNEHFRIQPKVAYNFDSFGHSGGLPQILKQAGYKMYIHLRPRNPDLELPSYLYRWCGVDGSEIVGYRIAVGLCHTEYIIPYILYPISNIQYLIPLYLYTVNRINFLYPDRLTKISFPSFKNNL